MRQYREVGVNAKVFSRGSCTTGLFLDLTKDKPSIGEGIVEFSFFSEGQDKAFDKRFNDFYQKPPTGHRMAGYYIMRYTLAPAISAVYRKAQDTEPREHSRCDCRTRCDHTRGKINLIITTGLHMAPSANENGKVVLKEVVPLKPSDLPVSN